MRRGLALALFALAPASSAGDLELVSIYGRADPLALAVDVNESVLVLAEGCVISVREQLEDAPYIGEELRSMTLDASVFELALAGDDLFVAGGSQGLFRIAWREDSMASSRIAATPEGVCTSVTTTDEWLHAIFTTGEGSKLLVFEREGLELRWTLDLGAELAHDVVARGNRAWVALGLEGCVRVQLPSSASGTPELQRNITLGERDGPDRNVEPLTCVRDLALGGDRLYAAASARVFSKSLDGPAGGARTARALDGKPVGYAVRVAANEERWFVAYLRGPADIADGAPYGLAGSIGLDLEIGAVPRGSYGLGTREWIESGSHARPRAVDHELALPACGFRTLEAGPTRLYAQLLRLGTRVWSCEDEELRELWTHRPDGQPLIDGVFSLADPDVVLFGADSQGSRVRGLLEVDDSNQLVLRAASADEPSLGLRVGAQWLDEEHDCEWLVAGRFLGWQLVRFQPGAAPELTRWELPPPLDPDGERGASYFSSVKHGDLLLGTRSRSRYGLVGWSSSALVDAALTAEPGSTLATPALFQQRTHAEEVELARTYTWNAALVATPSGSTLAVVAHGRFAPNDPRADRRGRARSAVYELREDAAPRLLEDLVGSEPRGHHISVATTRLDGRPLAALGDLAGTVELRELSDPEAARSLVTWHLPPNRRDGLPDSILDLAFVGQGADQELLLAAGRAGLICLSLPDFTQSPPPLSRRQVLDTPGWAAGLAVQRRGDKWRVLLGDQKCGARLYDW